MPVTSYQNFDLHFFHSGEEFRASVSDSPGGDANILFKLPSYTKDEWYFLGNLAELRRGVRPAASEATIDLTDLGARLYSAVFQGEMAAVFSASLDRSLQDEMGLRLRLHFSDETSDLATLPWEILYDPMQKRFLALSESSPILRYLSLPKPKPTLLVSPPLRMLTILVSPPDLNRLDLDREWRVLEKALSSLVADGKFVLDRLEPPTLSALHERLLLDDVHIIHFVGHGIFDEERGTGVLAFANDKGRVEKISGAELAILLHNQRSLRLVYLNACEGALSSHMTVFSGVSQTLVQQGVPAAIAMQAEITDDAAIDLSRLFYTTLAAGYPVDAALTQARVAISNRNVEWAIPVLFSRSPDNRLFDVVNVLPAPDCPYPGMVPFTEKQADVFFGRDKEISNAINRLRQYPFLTVIGPSGSGKSSLVYAGIIPALKRSKYFGLGESDVKVMRPGDKPASALAECLGVDSGTLSSVSFGRRTLLFVDQFEELFALASEQQSTTKDSPEADSKNINEAETFLNALNSLIGKPNLYILLTARADFYADMMSSSFWQPIRANRLELTPLGENELWSAIVEPAARVGVTVDNALAVQLIADAAGESGVLPLMQEALVLLWEKVEKRHLGLNTYRQMAEGTRNGLQVAIDRRANIVYKNLNDPAQRIARRILLQLVQIGEGRADTRRQMSVEDIRSVHDDVDCFNQTLKKLADSRLITLSGDENEQAAQVDIAHEALITGWGMFKTWLVENREALLFQRRLELLVKAWTNTPGDTSTLLRGTNLTVAEDWAERNPELFTTEQHKFVSASLLNKQREQSTDQRRRQFFRGLFLAIAILLVPGTFIGANTWMFAQKQRSEWQSIPGFPSQVVFSVAQTIDQTGGSSKRICVGTNGLGVGCSDDGNAWNLYQVGLPTGPSDWYTSKDRLWGYLLGGVWSETIKAVLSVAIDQEDRDHLVAFLGGEGLYESRTEGIRWISIQQTSSEPDFSKWQTAKVTLIGDMIVVGSSVVGREAGKIYLSFDAGKSWKMVDPNRTLGKINDFILGPQDQDGNFELIMTSETGLYSTNTANTELLVRIADRPTNEELYWLESDTSNQVIYIAAYNRKEKSSNVYNWHRGNNHLETWGSGQSGGAIRALAVNPKPSANDVLWALFESGAVYSVDTDGNFTSRGSRPGWIFSQTNTIWFWPYSDGQTDTYLPYLGQSDGVLQCSSCVPSKP